MGLVQRVQSVNHWIDDMLLALAPLLMKIGFVAGAMDILMSGLFSSNSLFQYGWAFTQAISVDAIFFVVLNAFWRSKIKTERWWFGGLIVLYGITAFFIVNVTSFEQLRSVNSSDAMRSLGIEPEVFTYVRSALVIVSAVLFYLVENLTHEHRTNANEQTVRVNEQTEQVANEDERNTNVPNAVVEEENAPAIEPPNILELPQPPPSDEALVAIILQRNPTIGPAALAREVGGGMDRARAFRLMKKVKNGS